MKLGVNLNAWKGKTAAAKEKIRSSATEYVRKTATKVLKEALNVSPQYSSDYVFSWRIVTSTNKNDRYSPGYKVKPWQKIWETKAKMGDQQAIRIRMNTELEYLADVKWNSNIRLLNVAPVHEKLEAREVRLRPENTISGNLTVMEHLKSKYSFLR